MGRYVKKRDDSTSMHYWYPGEKVDWVQAGIATGSGLVAVGVIRVLTGSWMWGAAVGFSVAAALSGLYLGRRDARALSVSKTGRLAGVIVAGLALLRALAKGSLAALAALVVVRLAVGGFWAHWVLPLVPAVIGAVAHHLGMFYEQFEKAAAVPVKASESALAKAVAERRQSLAATAASAGTTSSPEPVATPEPAPEPVGAAVESGMAASLPGEVDDTARWEQYPARPRAQGTQGEGAPAEGGRGRATGGRRAVFSRRRPGVREVV